MKNKIMLLWLCLILLSALVSAAPLPWAIAINQETKECAGYWAGDEYMAYNLREGWQAYYPEYMGGKDLIKTEFGSCEFTKPVSETQDDQERKCCQEFGLTFVSEPEKVSSPTYTFIYILIAAFLFVLISLAVLVALGFFILLLIRKLLKKNKAKRKKK